MLRCNESAGNFIVTMLHNEPEERRQKLDAHADVYREIKLSNGNSVEGEILESSPVISSVTPFIGELCVHEVAIMSAPFKYISPELFFLLTKNE